VRTAIDSSVLFCIFKGEPDARCWVDLLVRERSSGQLVICDVVYAEVATLFAECCELDAKLAALGIRFDAILPESAYRAGQVFLEYRRAGGRRDRLIPDFLVGAHALLQASALAARDRGYLRKYFSPLRLLELGTDQVNWGR